MSASMKLTAWWAKIGLPNVFRENSTAFIHPGPKVSRSLFLLALEVSRFAGFTDSGAPLGTPVPAR
jgi:hypothetical protein